MQLFCQAPHVLWDRQVTQASQWKTTTGQSMVQAGIKGSAPAAANLTEIDNPRHPHCNNLKQQPESNWTLKVKLETDWPVSFQFYFKLVGRHNVSGTQIYKWFRSFCCAQLCFWTDTHTSQGLGFLLRATLVQSKHVQILELTNHIEMRAMFFDMCCFANITLWKAEYYLVSTTTQVGPNRASTSLAR